MYVKSIGLRFFTVFGEWGRPDIFILKLLNSSFKNRKFYLNNNQIILEISLI